MMIDGVLYGPIPAGWLNWSPTSKCRRLSGFMEPFRTLSDLIIHLQTLNPTLEVISIDRFGDMNQLGC